MGQRINVLWGIVIAFLVVCVIWIGYSDYRMSKQVEKLRQQKIVLGTDEQLKETVNTLEKDLDERLAYETKVSGDPLDLTKVITSKAFLQSLGLRETLEQQGRMRLSCTATSPGGGVQMGVVKFMGRSYNLHEGDVFNGFRVDKISPSQMLLSKGGAQLVLAVERAPEEELSESTKPTSVSGRNY
jgi:hypothetical protein